MDVEKHINNILIENPKVCEGNNAECADVTKLIHNTLENDDRFTINGIVEDNEDKRKIINGLKDDDILLVKIPVYGSEYHYFAAVVSNGYVYTFQRFGSKPLWKTIFVLPLFKRLLASYIDNVENINSFSNTQSRLINNVYTFEQINERMMQNMMQNIMKNVKGDNSPITMNEIRNDNRARFSNSLSANENFTIQLIQLNKQAGGKNKSKRNNQTRKGHRKCKDLDMSIQPDGFKKLSPSDQVAWHMCYSKRLTRRATHIKRAREKQWLKAQAKDQMKWAEEIRKKHKLSAVSVE